MASCSDVMPQEKENGIEKNGMQVQWRFEGAKLIIKMTAPTYGWVTVGFNKTQSITGAHLFMGRVSRNRPEVVEHRTLSPGNYKPITALGEEISVSEISGFETDDLTTIKFSIDLESTNAQYRKYLFAGNTMWMILAFSQDDDFGHHSTMRTSNKINL